MENHEGNLVSVIIPTYNRRKFILQAVKSILAQGIDDIEVIVVDDGSTDGTSALFQPPPHRVRYIYQENAGVSAARNRGVAESSGALIAFLDSDDLWAPGKLRAQLDIDLSDLVLSFQGVSWFVDDKDDGSRLLAADQVTWPRLNAEGFIENPVLDIAEGRYLHLGTMLCTRQAFLDVGWFNTALTMGEDEDWFSRASLLKSFHYTPSPYLKRRFHAEQTSDYSEKSIKSLIRVFEGIVTRTARSHPRAARVARKRLAAKWSHLANCLNSQKRPHEAIKAMKTAWTLTPYNLARLFKLLVMSSTGLKPHRR